MRAGRVTLAENKIISEEANPNNEPSTVSVAPASSTYQQGIDDFYQSQAEIQKRKLDTSQEYICYIMSPFISEENMDCLDLPWITAIFLKLSGRDTRPS